MRKFVFLQVLKELEPTAADSAWEFPNLVMRSQMARKRELRAKVLTALLTFLSLGGVHTPYSCNLERTLYKLLLFGVH